MARQGQAHPGVSERWGGRLCRAARRMLAPLAAAGALGCAPAASAHALLLLSRPAAGAVLVQPPPQMRLDYTENVAAALSTFTVWDAERDVVSGRPRVAGRQVTVPLQPLAPGTYTLRWHVVSADDGHTTQGVVLFTIWHGGPLPAGAGLTGGTAAAGMQGGVAGALARALAFAGVFAVVGAAFVALALGRFPSRPAVLAAGAGFLLADAASFVLQGASAVGAAPGAFLLGGYASPALATAFGMHAALAAAGAVLASAGLVLGSATGLRRAVALAAAAGGAITVVAGFALGSHAAASVHPVAGAVVDGVHLAAVAAWGGGLAWLLASGPQLPRLVARFSPWALGLMALAAASGVANALFTLRAWSSLLDTLYGHVLDVKLALFTALLAAAAVSLGTVRRGRAAAARRTMGWEAALGAGVLAAAAVLVAAPPPAVPVTAGAYFQETARRGGVRLQLTVAPAVAGDNLVRVQLLGRASLHPPPSLAVSVRSLDMQMGTASLQLPRRGDGTYALTTGALSMAGTWQLAVRAGGVTLPFRLAVAPPRPRAGCDYGFDPTLRARMYDWGVGVQAIAVSPSAPDTVLVGTTAGVRLTTDGGRTWRRLPVAAGQSVVAAAIAPGGGPWYVATMGDLWASADHGRSWQHRPSPGPAIAALLPSPRLPRTLWAAAANGISVSGDEGRHWRLLASGSGADSVSRLAADPSAPGHLYAGGLSGILVSDDGGRTWALRARRARLAYGFAFAPGEPGTVWAAAMYAGLWVSRDGGRTWSESDQGVTNSSGMAIVALGSDRLLAGTMGGGLALSADGGVSWQTAGCPAAIVDELAVAQTAGGPLVWVGHTAGLVRLRPDA